MKRDELEAYLIRKGWIKDRWGHYQTPSGRTRMKMQAQSVRMERKAVTPAGQYSPKQTRWVRVRGANYSKLSINADDKLDGLTLDY